MSAAEPLWGEAIDLGGNKAPRSPWPGLAHARAARDGAVAMGATMGATSMNHCGLARTSKVQRP